MTPKESEKAVGRTRDLIAAALFLRALVKSLSVLLAAWVVVILSARVVRGSVDGTLLKSLVAPFAVALACALIDSRRRLPSLEKVRAALDCSSHAGGLLLSIDLEGAQNWVGKMPGIKPFGLRFASAMWYVALVIAAVLVPVVIMLPDRTFMRPKSVPLDIESEASRIEESIAELAEEKLMDEELAAQYMEQLANLLKEASGDNPARAYEALEHLQSALDSEAGNAAEKLANAVEAMAAMKAMAEALEEAANKGLLDEMALEKALENLSKIMQNDPALANAMQSQMADALKKSLEEGALSKEQLGELAKQLAKSQGSAIDSLKKMCDSGSCNPDKLKKAQDAAEGASGKGLAQSLEDLREYLRESKAGSECRKACAGLGQACMGAMGGDPDKPGVGGIGKGYAPSPGIGWKEESTTDGAAFRDSAMDVGMGDIKGSQLVGEGKAAPTETGEGAPVGGSSLPADAAGAGAAWGRTLLPQHRDPIQRYFDRVAAPSEE